MAGVQKCLDVLKKEKCESCHQTVVVQCLLNMTIEQVWAVYVLGLCPLTTTLVMHGHAAAGIS